ncbi:MAG: hypothetical protein J7J28_03455 [Thaumarchaeota archaeon]|nr:hypothetical protein [Nitrososphaerota archaeon]
MSEAVSSMKIEVADLEQLLLLTSSMRSTIIHLDEEKKLAYCFLVPIASLTPIIYYCRLEKVPAERFAYINRVTGEIRFGDKPSTEPNDISILMVRVKSGKML